MTILCDTVHVTVPDSLHETECATCGKFRQADSLTVISLGEDGDMFLAVGEPFEGRNPWDAGIEDDARLALRAELMKGVGLDDEEADEVLDDLSATYRQDWMFRDLKSGDALLCEGQSERPLGWPESVPVEFGDKATAPFAGVLFT